MISCHPNCTLDPNEDHPGYLGYRCVDGEGSALPFSGEEGCGAFTVGGHIIRESSCRACAEIGSDAPEWTSP